MLKTTVTSLLAFMFIVLIVLVPRDLNLSVDGYLVVANYSFDMGEYVAHIRDYFCRHSERDAGRNAVYRSVLGSGRFWGRRQKPAGYCIRFNPWICVWHSEGSPRL